MEQLADKIRSSYPEIPEEYFGHLAKPVTLKKPLNDETRNKDHVVGGPSSTVSINTGAIKTAKVLEYAKAPLLTSFWKSSDEVWTSKGAGTKDKHSIVMSPTMSNAIPSTSTTGPVIGVAPTFLASTRIATENAVSSKVSVLRASLKQSLHDSVAIESVNDSEEGQYVRDPNVHERNVHTSYKKSSAGGRGHGNGAGNLKKSITV
jgi:hypothetical protein